MSSLQRNGLLGGVRRLMMAGFAISAFSPILVERASAQATLPTLQDVTRETMTPNANWSELTIPAAPAPPTQPVVNNTGTWTFGSGDASAVVNFPALNKQLGRIVNYSVGGSTTYDSLDAVVTSPPNPTGNLASMTDTLTATGLGLTAKGTGTPYFYCLYTPCTSEMVFSNYNDSSQVTGTQTVYSSNIPWTGNATAFFQANQALYGAQSVTLKMSSVITNQAGTLTNYSVTGPYQANLGRALVPWTTDDIVSGTLKFNAITAPIGAAVGVGQLRVTPTPQLEFIGAGGRQSGWFHQFQLHPKIHQHGFCDVEQPLVGDRQSVGAADNCLSKRRHRHARHSGVKRSANGRRL